jgi:hypothetical protein
LRFPFERVDGAAGGGAALRMLSNQRSEPLQAKGQAFSELVTDTVMSGTPDQIYNLMFASRFLKDFMRDNQKLEGKSRVFFPGIKSC